MALHLIKLSVGPDSPAELAEWQTQRLEELRLAGQKPELMHITRHMPKRADELVKGGSIYWVIKGWLCARQRLLECRPVLRGDVAHCGLVYDKELLRVSPRPHRAFQGWRYFDSRDAPPDIAKGDIDEDMPDDMRRELASLGLL